MGNLSRRRVIGAGAVVLADLALRGDSSRQKPATRQAQAGSSDAGVRFWQAHGQIGSQLIDDARQPNGPLVIGQVVAVGVLPGGEHGALIRVARDGFGMGGAPGWLKLSYATDKSDQYRNFDSPATTFYEDSAFSDLQRADVVVVSVDGLFPGATGALIGNIKRPASIAIGEDEGLIYGSDGFVQPDLRPYHVLAAGDRARVVSFWNELASARTASCEQAIDAGTVLADPTNCPDFR